MLKRITVILTLLACCYCLENSEQLPEESRAKKKKGSLRLLAIVALAVFAKLAVVKVASFFFLVAFFQKIFYFGGLLLNYYMKNQSSGLPSPSPPTQTMYGPPQEYNTVGYSYEAPDHEPFLTPEGLPSISQLSNGFSWLFKNQAAH